MVQSSYKYMPVTKSCVFTILGVSTILSPQLFAMAAHFLPCEQHKDLVHCVLSTDDLINRCLLEYFLGTFLKIARE